MIETLPTILLCLAYIKEILSFIALIFSTIMIFKIWKILKKQSK